MIIAKKYNLLAYLVGFSLAATAAILFFWKHFVFSEPPFVIIGDKDILNKLHINVYMDRDEAPHSWKTIFLNGKLYPANNQDVDRFTVYVNYDGKLFIDYSYDNIAKMVNDESISPNTLLFCKIDSNVFLSDRFTRCDNLKDKQGLRKLLPLENIVNHDLFEAKENKNIKTDSDEESFVRNLKSSFFEVTN